MGENLYNAVATDMFGLLSRLRSNPDVIDCYTFGATLHVVGNDNFSAGQVEEALKKAGMEDVRIYPAIGTIEDLFIKQIRDGK